MQLKEELTQAALDGNRAKIEQLLVSAPKTEKAAALQYGVFTLANMREHNAVMLLCNKGGNLDSALEIYVQLQDVALTRAAIAAGANVNKKSFTAITLLERAMRVSQYSIDIIKCLITPRTNVNICFVANRNTPLHWAAQNSHLAVVEMLLSAGAQVNAKNSLDFTPLHSAVHSSHLGIIKALLAANADVNELTSTGDSALLIAAKANHTAIIAELIKAGADIFQKDQRDKTVFKILADLGNTNAIIVLLDAMMQSNTFRMPYSSVQIAIEYLALNHAPIIPPQLMDSLHFYNLLEVDNFDDASSWLDTHDSLLLHFTAIDGGTLLHGIAKYFDLAPSFMTKLYKRLNKADCHAKDFAGKTPLHWAARGNHPQLLSMLLADGADLFALDNNAQTALGIACFDLSQANDRLEAVKILRDAFIPAATQTSSFEGAHDGYGNLSSFRKQLPPAKREKVDLSIPESLQISLEFYAYLWSKRFGEAQAHLAQHPNLSLPNYIIWDQSLYHYLATSFESYPDAITGILLLLQSSAQRNRLDPYALDEDGKCAYEVVVETMSDLAKWFAAKSHHALFQLLDAENSKLITKIFVEGFIPAHEMVVIAENANNITDTKNMSLSPSKQTRLLSKEIDCLLGLATAAEDSLPPPLITKLNTCGAITATKAAPSKLLTADEHKKLCELILQIQNINRALLRDNASPAAAANIRDDQKSIIVSNDFLTDITNTSSNFFTMTGTASPFANIKPLICARHLMP